jgi:hypothetical protein
MSMEGQFGWMRCFRLTHRSQCPTASTTSPDEAAHHVYLLGVVGEVTGRRGGRAGYVRSHVAAPMAATQVI